MGGCAAINCSNHSRNGFRLFNFPKNPERRKKWTVNCRRDNWEPGPSAQLCEVHFEESQFESQRADGWKKLKPTAEPTLFNVPNPPKEITLKRQKGIGLPKPGSLLDPGLLNEITSPPEPDFDALHQRIADLEAENKLLREQLEAKDEALSSFMSAEQISMLGKEKKCIPRWSDDAVVKGLKLRFVFGKHGYEHLCSIGYPTPSYSTLNRRTQGISVDFGVLNSLVALLETKVEGMEENERNCCLLVDEMEIAAVQDFDKSAMSFVGNITLGKQDVVGKHCTVVLLRGLKSPWKQVIACEITGPSTSGFHMKDLVSRTLQAAKSVGLRIKAVVSDMGSNNKAMWASFGVSVTRQERKTSSVVGSDEMLYFIADVPHLIKNLRSAFLSRILILPDDVCAAESLPTKCVSSGYVKQLWISEVNSDTSLRSLHHLNKNHLFPTHFTRMNVATAVQLFSQKTAAALEKSVSLKVIAKEALSTAWFIRLVHEWFELMTARHPKKGITLKNRDKKFAFLRKVIDIVQNMQFGKGWKPVQTGIIMSTTSLISLAEECFSEGYSFFLPGRLTQDALENVFSQVRRKSGAKPTALQAKRALRLICISQFISDIKHSNYASDSDRHLLEFSSTSRTTAAVAPSRQNVQQPGPSKPLTASEENDIYFIAGATINAVLKYKLCAQCTESVKSAVDLNEPVVPKHRTLLTEYCDVGGLQKPTSGVYRVCRETERFVQKWKEDFLVNQKPLDGSVLQAIKDNCQHVILPTCCGLLDKIIHHYLIVRGKGIQNHMVNRKAYETCFSSASAHKKQKKQ